MTARSAVATGVHQIAPNEDAADRLNYAIGQLAPTDAADLIGDWLQRMDDVYAERILAATLQTIAWPLLQRLVHAALVRVAMEVTALDATIRSATHNREQLRAGFGSAARQLNGVLENGR